MNRKQRRQRQATAKTAAALLAGACYDYTSEGRVIRVSHPEATSRTLDALGKALSPNSISGVALTGGAAYASGPGAIAIPAAGMGMKAVANVMTRGRVQDLRNMLGRTPQQDAVARALLAQKNTLAPAAPSGAIGLIASILAEQNRQGE